MALDAAAEERQGVPLLPPQHRVGRRGPASLQRGGKWEQDALAVGGGGSQSQNSLRLVLCKK